MIFLISKTVDMYLRKSRFKTFFNFKCTLVKLEEKKTNIFNH